MARERSTARHARHTHPLLRLFVVLLTGAALVGGIVALGSVLGERDRDRDAMVTIEPTSGPTSPPGGTADDDPLEEPPPTGDPTAASTAGPSPGPATGPGPGVVGGPGTVSPDPTTPGSEPDTPGPGPAPRPGPTHPGGPGPSQSPAPDPPEDDPTDPGDPSPGDPSPDPPPTTPPAPPPDDPEPVPGIRCAAGTRIDHDILRYRLELTLTNRSDRALLGWTTTFRLPAGMAVSSVDGGRSVGSGRDAAIANDGNNAHVAPGGSWNVHVTVGGLGAQKAPSEVSLNGTRCER